MKSEASRAVVRMVSNYVRLAVTMGMGLVFVPFMLHWVGNEGNALVGLLGANIGMAAMFREITIRAVVQELAQADHAEDRVLFRRIFNSAMVVSTVMTFVAAGLFVIIYGMLNVLPIPAQLIPPAKAMVISQGIYVMVFTWLTPVYNMLLVRERFIEQNVWVIAERAAWLGSALLLSYGLGYNGNPPRDLTAFSWWVSGFNIATIMVPIVHLYVTDPDLRFRPSMIDRGITRELIRNTGRYIAVEAASALHEKVGMLIMFIFFKLEGSLIFQLALQFVSYVRQATQGVTYGIEAVSARLSVRKKDSIGALVHHGTRLHGLVALPVGVCAFLLVEPLLRLWLSRTLENPDQNFPPICLTAKILIVALTARAISDCWMMILYGAGHLKRYARLVLFGGLLNPFISVLIITFVPGGKSLYTVPIVFSVVYTLFHFILLPKVASRCLQLPYADLFTPLIRPAIVTALSAPVLVLAAKVVTAMGWKWNLLTVGAAAAAFGILFGLLSALIVLTPQERDRFLWSPLRKVSGRVSPATGA